MNLMDSIWHGNFHQINQRKLRGPLVRKLSTSKFHIIKFKFFSTGSLWSSFKKSIGVSGSPIDEKSEEHREEFTALVRELKNAFRHDNYLVSLTINPNVNSTCKNITHMKDHRFVFCENNISLFLSK